MGARRPLMRRASTWLVVYLVVLAFIGFWPQHIDRPYGSIIRKLIEIVPLLTYQRLEFGANVLLFVPFGLLLGVMLRRVPHLVVPLGFLASLLIESVQAVALDGRTPAVYDLVANTAGACAGVVLATLWMRGHGGAERPDSPGVEARPRDVPDRAPASAPQVRAIPDPVAPPASAAAPTRPATPGPAPPVGGHVLGRSVIDASGVTRREDAAGGPGRPINLRS